MSDQRENKASRVASEVEERRRFLPDGHPEVLMPKVGVLLVNLGTPDGHDVRSMRRYLREFLSDPRLIEVPRWLWYPLLYGFILNVRPRKSGARYAAIWNEELDESPLRTYSRAQAELLAPQLNDLPNVIVDWGFRYGSPGIAERLDDLRGRGCERILVLPLYPQYSATTTASVSDATFAALENMRWMPALRTVPAFHDDPAYIEALALSLEKHLSALDFEPEKVIASYHGIPLEYFHKGDPYHCQCLKTSRLLNERLGWPEGRLVSTFQSRFGPREWLQPYTDKTVTELAQNGVHKIAVFNPGFVSDCLETLEEIDLELRETYMRAGGSHFAHLPCLNESVEAIGMLETLVRRELSGWV